MNRWFADFTLCLEENGQPSADLVAAGLLSKTEAIDHYRFQYWTKVKEVVTESFPETISYLKEDWEIYWSIFEASHPTSPRSLDFYPDTFLEFFHTLNVPDYVKDLATFERQLEIYPWSHVPVKNIPLSNVTMESTLILGEYDILTFSTPVVSLYLKGRIDLNYKQQQILIYLSEDGMLFKSLESWEALVLENLDKGIQKALTHAPQKSELISEFFSWLGKSGLIQEVK